MLVALILIILAVAYRLVLAFSGGLHDVGAWNFAPIAAIALCGGIYLPRRFAAALPLLALFFSDILLNAHYHVALFDGQMIVRYFALMLTVMLGFAIRRSPKILYIIAGSIAGSTIFFVLTNTGSWLASEFYAKNVAGWTQALTTGVPGYPPTLLFFRNTLVSDLLFTLVFVACHEWTKRPVKSSAAERLNQTRSEVGI